MKQLSSPVPKAKDSDYVIKSEENFPYLTLKEAAESIEISAQRMSRLLKILGVPVYQLGHTFLLDDSAIERVKKAMRDNEVTPGRKKGMSS